MPSASGVPFGVFVVFKAYPRTIDIPSQDGCSEDSHGYGPVELGEEEEKCRRGACWQRRGLQAMRWLMTVWCGILRWDVDIDSSAWHGMHFRRAVLKLCMSFPCEVASRFATSRNLVWYDILVCKIDCMMLRASWSTHKRCFGAWRYEVASWAMIRGFGVHRDVAFANLLRRGRWRNICVSVEPRGVL